MPLIRALHLAFATVLPTLIGLTWGFIVALFTGSRRKGLNQMTQLLGFIGPLLAGIKISIKNPEHIPTNQAVIFIFNHQSSLDPILLCHVIQRNVIGIAKKELQRHPIAGPLLWFGETIFIDRLDKTSRKSAYAPAIEAISKGRSIAIAPEGTRVKHAPVGEFKLGAFNMAQVTGAAIVPIVFYNSRDRLPARSLLLSPGKVEIEILEPIHANIPEQELPALANKLQEQYSKLILDYRNQHQ